MSEWRFYGRERELQNLTTALVLDHGRAGSRRFDTGAIVVVGERGVGKSRIFDEIIERTNPNARNLRFELSAWPDPETGLSELIRKVSECGLANLLEELPPRRDFDQAQLRCVDIFRHLVEKGVIVAVDEFQHAEPLGIVGTIKQMIDDFVRRLSKPGKTSPPGKLVLLGSHQQQIRHMFRDDQPLYQRAASILNLLPWPVDTVSEMAAEHGILTHPGRFLTVWSICGGNPRKWEQFCEHERYSQVHDLAAWNDGRAWRREILNTEWSILREDLFERFDSRAFVELAPGLREAFLWLGRNRVGGAPLSELPEELRQQSKRGLYWEFRMLRDHLHWVEEEGPFLMDREPKWRISDNRCLFEINVFPQLFRKRRRVEDRINGNIGQDLSSNELDRCSRRMETLEGVMLERFASSCFRRSQGTEWALDAVWRPGLADIDLIAKSDQGNGPQLIIGGVKRNPNRHNADRFRADAEAFISDLGTSELETEIKSLPRRYHLISPLFTEGQRATYMDQGCACQDIHDLVTLGAWALIPVLWQC